MPTGVLPGVYIQTIGSELRGVQLVEVIHNLEGRFIEFLYVNKPLLQGRDLIYALHMSLFSSEIFLSFGKDKIIIINGFNTSYEFNIHPNIYINNYTTAREYFDIVKDIINIEEYGYDDYSIVQLSVKVWSVDHLRNKNIKITRNATNNSLIRSTSLINSKRCFSTNSVTTKDLINPGNSIAYKNRNVIKPMLVTKAAEKNKAMPFLTLDLETIDYNGEQIPLIIGLGYLDNSRVSVKTFILDLNLLQNQGTDTALEKLWSEFFIFLRTLCDKKIIYNVFAHNLGGFDGYFLYKGLLNFVGKDIVNVKTIIDQQNKFILISYKTPKGRIITFKDSFRIFPVSLNELCSIFGITGKPNPYKVEYNKVEVLSDKLLLAELMTYNISDCTSLLSSLFQAQKIYLNDYNVDIVSAVSTSSLAMKIFRTKFLEVDIPVLTKNLDHFVRQGYYGGATDHYLRTGSNLKYYDVNSLYPAAMINLMPMNGVKVDNIPKLEDFFGFCKVEVYLPSGIERPLLPVKYKDRTIFPTGRWTAVYFSEELKAALKYIPQYEFKILEGYAFTHCDIFSKYISVLYEIKKQMKGPGRWIAKNLLNCLYGTFGRKKNTTTVINVSASDLDLYLTKYVVISMIKISPQVYALIIKNNISTNILSKINLFLESDFKLQSDFSIVKNNVAIAAAITAHARIFMMPFRINSKVYYMDTDSIFVEASADIKGLVVCSDKLGDWKDELKGKTISRGIFLGIKQYWYQFINSFVEGKPVFIERSVFAGVTRDSLTFEDIMKLQKGGTIKTPVVDRFFKSIQTLKKDASNKPYQSSTLVHPYNLM